MQINVGTKPLLVHQAEFLETVDQLAGETRALFLTVSPGQELTYLMKLNEAKSFPNAPTPWIDSEALATGKTVQEVVQTILQTAQVWEIVGSQIEAARMKAKQIIKNATSVKEMYDAKNELQTTLNEVANGSY
jgi:hypothetical protein